jgi:RNA-directed DNA polymerase
MNPLIEGWLSLWDKLIGQHYRYRIDPDYLELSQDSEAFRFVYGLPNLYYTIALDLLRNQSLRGHFHYRRFTKQKTDGSLREILEPDFRLKSIQHSILKQYLNRALVHPAAVGFRRKHSIADHVWSHVGARIIITADIKDFFPSTSRYRVERWWETQFESEQAIKLATLLTTYQGCLPQGAPTSPALSNIVNYEMDKRLHERTIRSGGTYTRYADDMVFSWQPNYRPAADFQHTVASILREYGYRLHPDKGWCVYHADDEPQITGVILRKHGVTITDEMKQQIRKLALTEPFSARLAGYRGFQKMVEQHQSGTPYNNNRNLSNNQQYDSYSASDTNWDEYDDDEDFE